MVAAAIVGGAVVGGVATGISGNAAAGATKDASKAAIAQQDRALEQQATLSKPYRDLGESAIPQLRALLGLPPAAGPATPNGPPTLGGQAGYAPTAGGNMAGQMITLPDGRQVRMPGGPFMTANQGMTPTGQPTGGPPNASTVSQPSTGTMLQTLRDTPGYQFQKQEGLDATANKASSMGMALSGNTLRALDSYSTGLADSTYQQTVDNMMGVTGMGQAAAAGQAANVGTAAGNNSANLINQGNNLANIDVNTGAGISRAVGSAANQWAQQQTLSDIYDFYEKPRKEVSRG